MTSRPNPAVLALPLVLGLLLATPALSPAARESSFSVASGAIPPATPVDTILLTTHVETWLQMQTPPYNVGVTVKQKLERVGYRVTGDPSEPHDAVLAVTYLEEPGRTYRFLEQGTRITCRFALSIPPRHEGHAVISIDLETETGPTPLGSLYWDAVQRLEENPYYYFLGELLAGWLRREESATQVFAEVLRDPPLSISTAGEGATTTARQAANGLARRGAIEELGRSQDAKALDTLWHLAEHAARKEREAALVAIGELGEPSSRDRLLELHAAESDPALRAAIEASLSRLRAPR